LERKDVLVVKAALGIEGVVEGIDYRGVQAIGDVHAVPNSPWFIVARMDISEVYAPLRERLWSLIILIGALLAGAGAGIGLVWRQQRTKFYEEQLESEAKYRSIFDNAAEGIFQTTPEGKFLSANPAMARILGFSSPEELIRERADIARQGYVHPEKREEFKRLMEQQNKVSGFEYEVPRKDGSVAWVAETTQAVRDAAGRIVRYEGILIDITERKRAEKALLESELRFRTLYEYAKIGLYRTTPDGTILLANRALIKMLGYPSFEKLAEKNLEKDGFEPSYQRKEFLEMIEKNGEINNLESVWFRQDGSALFMTESAQAIRDSHGTTMYYDGMVEDITERKRAEEELLKKMDDLQRFHALAVGRELTMIELKREINALMEKAGQPKQYRIVE
jgi:PAS domain S-box-containing protein